MTSFRIKRCGVKGDALRCHCPDRFTVRRPASESAAVEKLQGCARVMKGGGFFPDEGGKKKDLRVRRQSRRIESNTPVVYASELNGGESS